MRDPDRACAAGKHPLEGERHLVSVVIRPEPFQALDYGDGERVSRAFAHGFVAHREAETGEGGSRADSGGDGFGVDVHHRRREHKGNRFGKRVVSDD